MNPSHLEELEAFLNSHDILWETLERKDRNALVREWARIFGNAFCSGMRFREGNKARHALAQMPAGDFLLFSAINEVPFLKSSEKRPRWGYRCKASTIPDLSQFHNLDFAVVASDFSWTMVYTHEDYALGGPYFAEKRWVTAPIGVWKAGNRRGKRRKHRSRGAL